MICQTSGGWVATATSSKGGVLTQETKRFSSFLAAKAWLIVMDDRHGTQCWARTALVISRPGSEGR
jgi:hypothetical protein